MGKGWGGIWEKKVNQSGEEGQKKKCYGGVIVKA